MPLLVQELDVEAAVLTRDSILAPAQEVEIDANGDGHVSKKAARAAARRCQPPAVTPSMDQINQILSTLGLTLADVKISVDGDTTTVQMFESVASLADVKEAVSKNKTPRGACRSPSLMKEGSVSTPWWWSGEMAIAAEVVVKRRYDPTRSSSSWRKPRMGSGSRCAVRLDEVHHEGAHRGALDGDRHAVLSRVKYEQAGWQP